MDMSTFSPALPIFLLLAALAIGVWQRVTVGGSTAVRSDRVDLPATGGTLSRVDTLRIDPQPSYR
jgi:hypothetical protein